MFFRKVSARLVPAFIFLATYASFAHEVKVTIRLSPTLGTFHSVSSELQGKIHKTAKGYGADELTVPLNTLRSGIELRDTHTLDALEAKKYPTAKLRQLKAEGGKFSGRFLLHGVEKPVSGTYLIQGSDLKATFTILYENFGIKKYRYKDVGVMNELNIQVSVPLERITPKPL